MRRRKAVDAEILKYPDIPYVASSIGFVLSISDTQFLIDYTKKCRKT